MADRLGPLFWARELRLGDSTFGSLRRGEFFRFGRGGPTSPVYLKTSPRRYREPGFHGRGRYFSTGLGTAVWRTV